MVKCEVCGKEFKTSQGLSSHRAVVHEGKVRGGMAILKEPGELRNKAESILELAIGDLCGACQGKIKDKLFPSETLVRVVPSSSKVAEAPEVKKRVSWWHTEPKAEEPGKGGSVLSWVILIGLLLYFQSKPRVSQGLFTDARD